jgi:hypothetical protein
MAFIVRPVERTLEIKCHAVHAWQAHTGITNTRRCTSSLASRGERTVGLSLLVSSGTTGAREQGHGFWISSLGDIHTRGLRAMESLFAPGSAPGLSLPTPYQSLQNLTTLGGDASGCTGSLVCSVARRRKRHRTLFPPEEAAPAGWGRRLRLFRNFRVFDGKKSKVAEHVQQ